MEAANKHRLSSVAVADQAADGDLFARIRGGDERAFEELFRSHAKELCRHAYHYLESAALAEEVVQDVLLRVWEHRATLTPPASARAYLHTAVRNRALDVMKAARSSARTHASGGVGPDQSAIGMSEPPCSPFEEIERRELAAALRGALRKLPERMPDRVRTSLGVASVVRGDRRTTRHLHQSRRATPPARAQAISQVTPEIFPVRVNGGGFPTGVVYLCVWTTPTASRGAAENLPPKSSSALNSTSQMS